MCVVGAWSVVSAKNTTRQWMHTKRIWHDWFGNWLGCMRDWIVDAAALWVPVGYKIGLWWKRRWRLGVQLNNQQLDGWFRRVSDGARARLIHTICECNQARYTELVNLQMQNFIIFGVDALIIWLSKHLLLLSIMRTRIALNVWEVNCGNSPRSRYQLYYHLRHRLWWPAHDLKC